MALGYRLIDRPPDVEHYRRLRSVCGLSAMSIEAASAGLPNSWFGITMLDGDRPIGMGRIVGDGGCFFQIVDIAVEPEHQGRGLGKKIMAALMDRLSACAPEGAYVSLIADGEARHLYARFGFQPTAPASIGMAQFLRKAATAP